MSHEILFQVQTKLKRAQSHQASLETDVNRWQLEQRDAVQASPVLNRGKYEYQVDDIPKMPTLRCGAVIGDVLHNLRSTLDYLAWHAAKASVAGEIKNPERVVFPIATTTGLYAKSPATRQFSLAYQDFFLHFQPFNPWPGPDRWVGPYEHPLSILQRLSNADKHRLITPILGRQGAIKLPAAIPTGAAAAGATNDPLERGAVILRIRRQLVRADPPPTIRVSPFVALASLEGVGHALRRLVDAVDFVHSQAASSSLFKRQP